MPIMAIPEHERRSSSWLVEQIDVVLDARLIDRVVVVDFPDPELTSRFPQPTLVPFLQVLLAGTMDIETDAGATTLHCEAGTAVYWPPKTRVAITASEDHRILRATWDEDLCFACEARHDPARPIKGTKEGLVLPGAAPALERTLARELSKPGPPGRQRVLVEGLLLALRDRARTPEAAQAQRRQRRWPQIAAMLRRTCTRTGFGREQVARMAGIHPNHLSRLARQHTGMSLQQVVLQMRVAAAADLLRDTNLSIAEIAERCQFSSPSHFVRVFKQEHGVTPAMWRKQRAGL